MFLHGYVRVCLCVSVCLCVCVSVCLYVFASVRLYICAYVRLCFGFYMFACRFVGLRYDVFVLLCDLVCCALVLGSCGYLHL
jgi:hypothetical protein